MWVMVVQTSSRYNTALMCDAASATHRQAIRFAQPVGFKALLRGNGIIAIENAVAVQ